MLALLKKIIKLPLSFCRKIRNYFFVRMFFKKYKDDSLIWIYPHIGDMFYGLLYVQLFKQQYGIKKIRLIGNERYAELYKLFEGIDSYALLPEKYIWRFAFSSCGHFTKKLIYKNISNGRFYTNDFIFMKKIVPTNQNEGCLNYTKRVVYKLPSECQYIKPNFPKYFMDGYDYKRMIILSPYAKSIREIGGNFFTDLVSILKQRGYDVYTNVSPTEQEITGTERLECSLLDLYNHASNAVGFIGLRSGICDLIAMTDIPMYVLFNNYPLGRFATLQEYRDGIVEFYGTQYDEYLQTILKDFDNVN